jgi:hypothetical protein
VTIAVSSDYVNGAQTGGSGDFALLRDDNFFSLGGEAWRVTLTGLTDGTYTIYLYDPKNTLVGTGSGSVNGVPFSNVNDPSIDVSFIQGTNCLRIDGVTVAAGMLSATGSGLPYSGLAGMQLVPVPEPTPGLLLGTGGMLLLAKCRRRNKQPS